MATIGTTATATTFCAVAVDTRTRGKTPTRARAATVVASASDTESEGTLTPATLPEVRAEMVKIRVGATRKRAISWSSVAGDPILEAPPSQAGARERRSPIKGDPSLALD